MALAATEVVLLNFFHQYPESADFDAPPPAPDGAAALVSAVSAAVAPPPPPADALTAAPTKLLHTVPLLTSLDEPGARDLKTRVQEIEVPVPFRVYNTLHPSGSTVTVVRLGRLQPPMGTPRRIYPAGRL